MTESAEEESPILPYDGVRGFCNKSVQLVECVPNFSEGRRAETIARLAQEVETVDGAFVLDTHMDPDHNRSVITFVADPETIVEAAVRVVALAAKLIDLGQHTGQHPRLGATDVLPFVPVRGVSLDDCVRLAHRAGERIAHEIGIPVYFYESAARRPERTNLEDVRRGGYERLLEEIALIPARAPDVGAARLHANAGAIAVGARALLIAYNVNLHTADVSVARRIARAVRGRDGGLRYLKALGFQLDERGLAQVSMNLTRYELTTLHHAFEAVRREAERWGVRVAGSEIVGLVPQAAIDKSAEYFLQIENFSPDLVLENRLAAAIQRRNEKREGEASADASTGDQGSVSGGGAAAAHTAALAASLGEALARLIERRAEPGETKQEARDALQELTVLHERLIEAARDDEASFERVLAARRLPKATDDERRARDGRIEAALKGATTVPLETAGIAVQVGELIEMLADVSAPAWLSDAASGAQLSLAAVAAAHYNVLVNTAAIEDEEFTSEQRGRAAALLERARSSAARVEAMLMDSL